MCAACAVTHAHQYTRPTPVPSLTLTNTHGPRSPTHTAHAHQYTRPTPVPIGCSFFAPLSRKENWPLLIGTAGGWFLFDITFYGHFLLLSFPRSPSLSLTHSLTHSFTQSLLLRPVCLLTLMMPPSAHTLISP